jgi:hypothetical protein
MCVFDLDIEYPLTVFIDGGGDYAGAAARFDRRRLGSIGRCSCLVFVPAFCFLQSHGTPPVSKPDGAGSSLIAESALLAANSRLFRLNIIAFDKISIRKPRAGSLGFIKL